MQTFLPYPCFVATAKVLDYRRLGKQRIEARQIVDALGRKSKGWAQHPVARMWDGYELALMRYFNVISREWIERGYQHNMGMYPLPKHIPLPDWYGDERLHASHRAALLFKEPAYYERFGWAEEPAYAYHWPVSREAAEARREQLAATPGLRPVLRTISPAPVGQSPDTVRFPPYL
jgi:hypothetical protein